MSVTSLLGLLTAFSVFTMECPRNERAGADIGAAVMRFRGDTGHYPQALDELQPKYMAHVPQCWYGLWAWPFAYWVEDGSPHLKYINAPGFGARVYYCEEGRWRSSTL
jgi:hypothetical protein